MGDALLMVYLSAALLFLVIVLMHEPTVRKGNNTAFEYLIVVFVSLIWPISVLAAVWLYTKKREKEQRF